jgi:hypothetical protein
MRASLLVMLSCILEYHDKLQSFSCREFPLNNSQLVTLGDLFFGSPFYVDFPV